MFNICVQRQKGRMFISNLLFKIGGGGGGGGKVQIHVVHFVDKRISISTYVHINDVISIRSNTLTIILPMKICNNNNRF